MSALIHEKRLPAVAALPVTRTNDPLEREAEAFADRLGSPTHGRRGVRASLARVEKHLGRSFSGVRIHADGAAAAAADRMGARAYTVGRDIVFGRNQFAPESAQGQRLLVHELAHVAQQDGSTSKLWRAPRMIMRSCMPSPLPAPPLPIDAVFPIWSLAERCIVNLYKADHRGNTVASDIGWLAARGKDEQERKALKCLKGGSGGPHFTAKSGVFPGKPDIWDFTQGTMYEITTRLGYPLRKGKLEANTKLASSITSSADCGGRQFTTGTWQPTPSYSIGPGLWMTATNRTGVIVYGVFTDGKAAVSAALLLGALKAAKRFGKQAGKRLAGGPALAAASAVAAIVLLSSGKAEAKLGPGDEDPLETLFKALEQEGVPAPKELQDFIDADPALKERIAKAMKDGNKGEVKDALSRAYLDLLAKHKDEFTQEELEYLLTVSQLAGDQLPQSELTVETLRKMADAKGAGGTGAEGGTKGGEAKPGSTPPRETESGGPVPEEEAAPTPTPQAGETPGGVPTTTPAPPKAEVTEKFPQLSSASRRLIAGAPAAVRRVFDAMTSRTGDGFPLDDAIVSRFFRTVPPDLQDAEADAIVQSVEAAPKATLDDVFSSLENAVTDARAKAAASAPTTSTGTSADDVRKALANMVASSDFAGIAPGDQHTLWGSQKPAKGARLSGTMLFVTPTGQKVGGFVTFDIVTLQGDTIQFKIVGATDLVDASGTVVVPAASLRGAVFGRKLLRGKP